MQGSGDRLCNPSKFRFIEALARVKMQSLGHQTLRLGTTARFESIDACKFLGSRDTCVSDRDFLKWRQRLGMERQISLRITCSMLFCFFLVILTNISRFRISLPPPPHTPFHTPVEYLLAEIKRFCQYSNLLKPIGNIAHLSIPQPLFVFDDHKRSSYE